MVCALGTANFFSSEEQKINLRSTFGGGLGRYFFRSTVRYLAVGAGAVWTRERYTDPLIPLRNSGESFLSVEYMTKRLKVADVLTRFNIYPSLTDPGRYRITFNSDISLNLHGDWYMKTGYYNNFDSAPPGNLPRNDYGWRNAFGYKF